MLKSMTAYVSAVHNHKDFLISCDIKSVNGKTLDINLKSNFLKANTELAIRNLISSRVHRGTLEISLNLESNQQTTFQLNKKLVKEIQKELNNSILDIKELSFSDLKDIPDIFLENKSPNISEKVIKDFFKKTLKELIDSKELEGKKIKKAFNERIIKINKQIVLLSQKIKNNNPKRKKNILKKLKLVCFDASDDSISNEIMSQIIRSDTSEEIDRLNFHISSLLDELKSKKAKGKKIDFILLEMLREINTTLAKVAFSEEKKHGLNVKILIEEMREQVCNVE